MVKDPAGFGNVNCIPDYGIKCGESSLPSVWRANKPFSEEGITLTHLKARYNNVQGPPPNIGVCLECLVDQQLSCGDLTTFCAEFRPKWFAHLLEGVAPYTSRAWRKAELAHSWRVSLDFSSGSVWVHLWKAVSFATAQRNDSQRRRVVGEHCSAQHFTPVPLSYPSAQRASPPRVRSSWIELKNRLSLAATWPAEFSAGTSFYSSVINPRKVRHIMETLT